jgi:hypothetical protein
MWPEITLELFNEEAVKEYDRRVKAGLIRNRDIHAVYPLSVLMQRMRKGPPFLSHLINALGGEMFTEDFVELVRDLLPDREEEILAANADERIDKFCALFSQRYFPLYNDRFGQDLDNFVRSIPIEVQGISEQFYHDFADLRPGYILMLSLINSPFEYEYLEGDSSQKMLASDKVPILDMTGTLIQDIDLLKRIPRHGWSNLEIRKRVQGTPLWWGLADYADWVDRATEWELLNYSHDDAIITIPWSLEAVKTMTIEWPRIVAFWKRIDEVAAWLEKDIPGHYRELVEALLNWQPSSPKRKQRVKKIEQEVLNHEQKEDSARSDLVQIA